MGFENNIEILVNTFPTGLTHQTGGVPPPASPHRCTINNFPLQRWVNLIICLNNRTLDVYLNGKLVRTCVLPGIAKVDVSKDVFITPLGGFSGFTSNFQFWPNATNPQEAYNIYKKGFGGSALGNLFNKYRIKFVFLVDNQEQGSFEI